MTEKLIDARGISLSIDNHSILQNVDLALSTGEIVTLIGPNGAGKTTLVRVVLGLTQPSAGSLERKAGITIGYMPQRLQINPTLPMTVARFLALTRQSTNAVTDALEQVGTAHLLNSPLQQISGGELQRVLLARALLRDPQLLVLDEPVQGVDVAGQTALYELISTLRDRLGCGVLMVSHDLHLVMAQTDRVMCLNHHVCCHGHPEQVSNDPAYLALFGKQHSDALAIYHHHHDHAHDIHGNIVKEQSTP